MNPPLVYLAGPITGCTYGDCTDWRKHAFNELAFHSITALSPMRHKDFLSGHKDLLALGYDFHVLSTQRGITARDRFDCTRCDVVLVNVIGAKTISAGTCMEIAWADLSRIPIVLAMEKGNVHEHAMIRECCPFRVETLEEALKVVHFILTPSP